MEIKYWLGEDNTLGLDIWKKKYQRNDETFDEWIERVSGGNKEVAELILQKKFLFGGRILSNRGVSDNDEKVTYSNCYVLEPPEDSIESIYETCKKLARTYSYGGGCGIDISKLAPEGAKVNNQAKSTSGAVSFMDTFSQVTEQIGQNGRRGALMISIDCTHPDLEKFINIKSDLGKVTSANISVRVSNDFMRAVVSDDDWELYFERPETGEYISKTVKAKEIFRLLCENNWNYAEPGLLFWDNITGYNLLANDDYFEYAGVNPCAEEPLPAGGSCLLGALNLSEFVDDEGKFQWEDFKQSVRIAVRGLNEVLDEGLDKHPLKEQRDSVRDWRQIGLGIMGLADMLIKLELPYGSVASVDFCDKVGRTLTRTAIDESSKLAAEYGTYSKYTDAVTDTEFFKYHSDDTLLAHVETYGLRNSQLLTVAPTGTISTMIGVSGGIEPIFANSYERLTKSLHGEDVKYKVYTPIVEQYMKEHGITEAELPNWFVTSKDIPVESRIAMQSVWQNHIDASISSTVNLPKEATVEDVENLYIKAWEYGLKGITIYRSGCAREGILTEHTTDKKPVEPTNNKVNYNSIVPVSRKSIGVTHGSTYCKKSACGTLYITLNRDDEGNLVESFVQTSKGGICQANIGAVNRMVSVALRSGVKVDEIVDQLKGINCAACNKLLAKGEKLDGISCSDILAKTLAEFNCSKPVITETPNSEKCPECGGLIKHDGGCVSCLECGWSKCNL